MVHHHASLPPPAQSSSERRAAMGIDGLKDVSTIPAAPRACSPCVRVGIQRGIKKWFCVKHVRTGEGCRLEEHDSREGRGIFCCAHLRVAFCTSPRTFLVVLGSGKDINKR